jgi:hypothetical protein
LFRVSDDAANGGSIVGGRTAGSSQGRDMTVLGKSKES